MFSILASPPQACFTAKAGGILQENTQLKTVKAKKP